MTRPDQHQTSTAALRDIDLTLGRDLRAPHVDAPDWWLRLPWRVRTAMSGFLVPALLLLSAMRNFEMRWRFLASVAVLLSMSPAIGIALTLSALGPRVVFDVLVGNVDRMLWWFDAWVDPK